MAAFLDMRYGDIQQLELDSLLLLSLIAIRESRITPMKPAAKLRRFQFSLRTLLIVMTASGVLAGLGIRQFMKWRDGATAPGWNYQTNDLDY